MHDSRYRRHGDPHIVLKNMNHLPTCTVDGCERKPAGNGFCNMHNQRYKKTGDPGPAAPMRNMNHPDICKVVGCEKKYDQNGFCAMHDSRYKKYGDPGQVASTRNMNHPDICKVKDCDRKYKSNGLCKMHYQREYWRLHPEKKVERGRKQREAKKAKQIKDSVIYFMGALGGNHIKIGYTDQIDDRVQQLQSGNGYELIVLHTMPGTVDDEWRLHKQFKDYKIRGEWFEFRPVYEYIQELPDNENRRQG